MHSSQQKSSLFANLMLIAGSLVVTVLMLVVLEAGLRLAGIGAADEAVASRLKYQQIYLPVIQPSQRPDGTDILRTTDSRLPYQSILAEKPADGLRIFTFGGSATAGLGFSPNVTFARHLERMLETAYPERTVEVVNLGIVALAARQVRVLVEDACRNFEPDAVLVYSGNNEFLEMHAEKYAAANAGMLARLGDHLLKTNLYRLLDRILRGPPDTPSLGNQNMSIADLQMTEDELIRDIEVTPEEIEAVLLHPIERGPLHHLLYKAEPSLRKAFPHAEVTLSKSERITNRSFPQLAARIGRIAKAMGAPNSHAYMIDGGLENLKLEDTPTPST